MRAGFPTASELTAIACTVLVVTVQVVGASMRWSDQRPYAVDLRSARATPAPPVMMVGYSARLALSTTFTGLLFSALARLPDPTISLLVAVPCLAWSTMRLLRTAAPLDRPVRAGAGRHHRRCLTLPRREGTRRVPTRVLRMDFSPSPRAADLREKVAEFLADEIEPIEPAYHRDLAEARPRRPSGRRCRSSRS